MAAGLIIAVPVTLTVPLTIAAEPAAAAPSFDPRLIITDGLFYDGNAMSSAQIQSFLDGNIGACQNGRCLNVAVLPVASRAVEYSQTTGNLICNAITGGNLRVSELIYRTQVACGISAKVILVTLQKEQGLVTSNAPGDWALKAAMGMGCPDTAPCDDAFSGLAVQIMTGARQLKAYKAAAFGRQPGTSWVGYNPDPSCGGTYVDVANYATAALYNYTPYQPNSAALGNLYGIGDSCSSYGNRNFWRMYRDWFGSPTDIAPTGVTVSRIGGTDRFASSAAISASIFSPGVPVAYVASGANFADAISAAPAAAKGGGPVLLLSLNEIPSAIQSELVRLAPQKIVIVGGTGAVSDRVATQLAQFAPVVDRVAGQDRYETSRAVVSYAFGTSVPAMFIAAGSMFADALSATAAAGSRGAPVLLVDGAQPDIDTATRDLLASLGTRTVYISGGTAVVTPGIEQSLVSRHGVTAVVRLSGSNRYDTSAAVNRDRFPTAGTFYVASGEEFPDALGAAPVAAVQGFPLYVTPPGCMPRALLQHLIDSGATKVVIVGGTGAVSSAAAAFRNC